MNDTFLAKQPVLDPTGRRYTPVPRDGKAPDSHPVRLILPESLGRQAAAITEAIPYVLSSSFNRHTQLVTLRAKSGQRLFAYNPGNQVYNAAHSPKEDRSLVRDPVLVVVPNGSKFLSDDRYTALATQEGVVFPNPDDVLSVIEADKANKLQTYVTAVRPVAQNFALKLRDAVNEFRLQLFNLVLAVTVLLIAGVGVCIIYSRKNAQAIFVQHISGWRYVVTHRFILSVEVALAVLLATRVPFETWLQNQELEKVAASGTPLLHPLVHLTELDLGIIAGLVAVELGAVLLALAVFHRHIVREGVTEA
ncbi:hypothetical protein ACFYT4_19610 [Streptomyces sp. NPDC004609]|uniref:hypothetical protein n=1 Tax=Streptomyces sp. NPDC004609 TaxID=3364704 RepID=UPI0036B4F86C